MHELTKEQLVMVNKGEGLAPTESRAAMWRSFHKADKEVIAPVQMRALLVGVMLSRKTSPSNSLSSLAPCSPCEILPEDGGGGVGVADFDASSIWLVKTVQNFIERGSEKQLVAKCGCNSCICTDDDSNNNFDDELDIFRRLCQVGD
ncbi:Tubby-like F-box protein [Psidium guajava]|nr:Tubby-like F-box protein [Psidium guajava]